MDESAAGAMAARSGPTAVLREADWIAGHRVRAYAIGAICAYLAWAVIGIVRGYWLYQTNGLPVPSDFVAFWSAAHMAIEGQAAQAYDWAAHHAAQVAALGAEFEGFFAWHNPPHFLLVVLPFAALPYVPGWLAFDLATVLLFLLVFRQVLPVRGAWLVALGAPAGLLCIIAGQLGFLVATLTGAALVLLDRRPVMAGASLGLLTIKPHYGVLFPLLLIATGRWRVFAVAAATTLALMAISAALFGVESWIAFYRSLTGETFGILLQGGADWTKLQSLYACFHWLTGRERLAMALHAVCAITIAAAVLWLWRLKGASDGARAAAAIAGSFLITPYSYVYDAVTAVLAAAFLAREMLARGDLPWERFLICLAVIAPAGFFFVGSFATPVAMLMLLALAVRRGLGEARA